MCGGSGGGEDPVKHQREQERQRQLRIDEGKAQLDAIFGGGTLGSERIEDFSSLKPGQTYYKADGTEYTLPMVTTTKPGYVDAKTGAAVDSRTPGIYGSVHTNDSEAFQRNQRKAEAANRDTLQGRVSSGEILPVTSTNVDAEAAKQALEAGLYAGAQTAEGFGEDFYDQRAQAYKDFANPQLQDQYGDAREQLTFALARQGQIGGSSLEGDRAADLGRDFKLQQQSIADKGRGYANDAKADMAQQKQSLLTMLNSTADAGGTAEAARAAVDNLRTTPSFSPLGPLFQNATAGLAAGYGGRQNKQQRDQFNQIVYGGDPDRGSGSVIRG